MKEADIAAYFQVGDTFPSRYNGLMKVIEYKHRHHVLIEFVMSGTVKRVTALQVLCGNVIDHVSQKNTWAPVSDRIYRSNYEKEVMPGSMHINRKGEWVKVIKHKSEEHIEVKYLSTGVTRVLTETELRTDF